MMGDWRAFAVKIFSFHIGLVGMFIGLLCMPAMGALAASPEITQASGLLRRAESNLQSVASSLQGRTSPPAGSAARVLASRLESSLTDLNAAKTLIDKAPAGAEGRDEVAARYASAVAEYNRLNAIMTGADPAAAPQEAPSGTPLNYQQKEQLSAAEFNIREVTGAAQRLTENTEAMRAVEDQLSINFREVKGLLAVVEDAQRKTGFARDSLAKLPTDGEGVARATQNLASAEAKVTTAATYLRDLDTKLQAVIDPANHPQFASDAARLRDLSIMFARPEMLMTERALAAETYAQAGAAMDECVTLIRRYARLIQQETDQGKMLEGVGNAFLRNHANFVAAAESQKATLPGEIRKDLQTARQHADNAVANQTPLWFTGGIPQVMGFAEEKLALLSAIDAESGAALRKELEANRAHIRQQADSLRELIIRENEMPADRFEGPDRDKAIETAISGWRVQQKEFELLKVRIPAEAWARETKWTYRNGAWHFSDRSKLQVRLLIADKANPELAIDRAINVWKDHQKGDTMIGVPLFGIEDELQPIDYLLRSKIKE